ncbi:MAG: hypothetical protein ACEQSX_14590, partial [Baekduiaceae bacterium]
MPLALCAPAGAAVQTSDVDGYVTATALDDGAILTTRGGSPISELAPLLLTKPAGSPVLSTLDLTAERDASPFTWPRPGGGATVVFRGWDDERFVTLWNRTPAGGLGPADIRLLDGTTVSGARFPSYTGFEVVSSTPAGDELARVNDFLDPGSDPEILLLRRAGEQTWRQIPAPSSFESLPGGSQLTTDGRIVAVGLPGSYSDVVIRAEIFADGAWSHAHEIAQLDAFQPRSLYVGDAIDTESGPDGTVVVAWSGVRDDTRLIETAALARGATRFSAPSLITGARDRTELRLVVGDGGETVLDIETRIARGAVRDVIATGPHAGPYVLREGASVSNANARGDVLLLLRGESEPRLVTRAAPGAPSTETAFPQEAQASYLAPKAPTLTWLASSGDRHSIVRGGPQGVTSTTLVRCGAIDAGQVVGAGDRVAVLTSGAGRGEVAYPAGPAGAWRVVPVPAGDSNRLSLAPTGDMRASAGAYAPDGPARLTALTGAVSDGAPAPGASGGSC